MCKGEARLFIIHQPLATQVFIIHLKIRSLKSTRSVVCNHGNAVNVIRNLLRYVINPKERNIQVLRLDDIPCALQTDYIRLTAITYQSFGLDKNKALRDEVLYFLGVLNLVARIKYA